MRVEKQTTVTVTLLDKEHSRLLGFLKDYRNDLREVSSMAEQEYLDQLNQTIDGLMI